MAKSKLLAISGLVLVLVLALTCGLVFTVGSTPNTDVNAAVSHTDHEGWTDLNSYVTSNGMTLVGGKYYLSANLTKNDYGDKLTFANSANVIICLNGYILTVEGIEGMGQLTLEDCNTAALNQYYEDSNGVWKFDDGTPEWDTAYQSAEVTGTVRGGVLSSPINIYGTLTMNGGTISGVSMSDPVVSFDGNFVINDGAISGNTAYTAVMARYGTLTMNAGTISDNTGTGPSFYSAAVTTDGSYDNPVTFTMNGGTISGNTSQNGGGVSVNGSNDTFIMKGGTISGNTAFYDGDYDGYGGGVYLSSPSSTFIMEGGTISGNTASKSGSAIYASWDNANITLAGGKIDGTIATSSGQAIKVTGGRFATANVSANTVGTDTAEGGNGAMIYPGYRVVKDNADAQYPYSVEAAALPDTVTHEGTADWYALSVWLDEVGTILLDGKYFVDQDITLTTTLLIDGEVTLCLNGHKLAANGSGDVVSVNDGKSLTLQDCNSAKLSHPYYADSTGLWVFNNGQDGWQAAYNSATVKGTVQGGVITGGEHGVSVESSATLTMKGGTISGNRTSDSGGGLYVSGTASMSGGAISGNTSDHSSYGGGGVFVNGNADFTMSGGTISYNTAQIGGGVVVNGLFTMTGGTISDNKASEGGGVYLYGGNFIMEGGTISGNAATLGGGVGTSARSEFSIRGGTITDNTATTSGSAIYVSNSYTVTISGGKIGGTIVDVNSTLQVKGGRYQLANVDTKKVGTDTAEGDNGVALALGCTLTKDGADAQYPYLVQQLPPPETVSHEGTGGWYKLSEWLASRGLTLSEGKYFVDKDITLTGSLSIEGNVTLCLDGNKLVGNGTASVITVQSGYTLTLQDCNSTSRTHDYYVDGTGLWVFNNGQDGWHDAYQAAGADKQGTVSGGVITAGFRGVYVDTEGTLTMTGGTISGNTSSGDGGGVYVELGTFTMNGGAISGNNGRAGGGVAVMASEFTMTAGTISNNVAERGSGVSLDYYGYRDVIPTFNMEGGTISGNTATDDYYGGTVFLGQQCVFNMNGGTISDNTAAAGGGVHVTGGGSFNMTDGTISGNTATHDYYGGGGVYVEGTFSMSGGTISGNSATSNGGGVFVGNYSRFTMSAGTIADNTATEFGNGVFLYDSSSTFTMSGGFMKDKIEKYYDYGVVNIIGGYFVEGDVGQNTIQGFGVGDSTVVALDTGSPEYQQGYRFTIQISVTLSVEGPNSSQYDGSAIANKQDFSMVATISGYSSPDYDFTFEYAPQGTADFEVGLPTDMGKYTIKATLNYLSQTYTHQFDFEITKRMLILSGLGGVDRQYDGTTNVELSGVLLGVLDGDDVKLELGTGTIESADVGNNKVVTHNITLSGANVDNYDYVIPTLYVNITPRQIHVTWSATEFVYNGALQQPFAAIDGVVDGEIVKFITTIDQSINAGTSYSATVTMESPNPNYELVGSELTYSILPKALTVNWEYAETVYNGALQQPTATVATGIEGETVNIVVDAVDSINAGRYNVTATMETPNSNYTLIGAKHSYVILPKTLIVVWGETEFVYDGQVHLPTATVVDEDGKPVTETVIVANGQTEVGTYTASVHISDNYVINNASVTFTIVQNNNSTGVSLGIIGGVTAVCALTLLGVWLVVKKFKV